MNGGDTTFLLRTAADLARKNPVGARELLYSEPQLAYAILHAGFLSGVISPNDAERFIYGGTEFTQGNGIQQQQQQQQVFPQGVGTDTANSNNNNSYELTNEKKEMIRLALSLTEEDLLKFSEDERRELIAVRQTFKQ